MKKSLLGLLAVLAFSYTVSAQKSITTVHFYDVKNATMEQNYLGSLREINAIMKEIGFPNNYYSYMKLSASDTTVPYVRACSTFDRFDLNSVMSEPAAKDFLSAPLKITQRTPESPFDN